MIEDQIPEEKIEKWIPFKADVSNIPLPAKFTFPFYYEPHPLCEIAAQELQEFIQAQEHWTHNFGLNPNMSGMVIGKMFGVLVVQHKNGKLGYLAAFSGKLDGINHHKGFVPPIFDMLTIDGFFRKEEEVLNALNRQIEELENDPKLAKLNTELQAEKALAQTKIKALKSEQKTAKQARKKCRLEAKNALDEAAYETLENQLIKESLTDKFILKDTTKYWKERINQIERKVQAKQDIILAKRTERKTRSAILQQKLFDQYHFLNINGERKSLVDIFEPTTLTKPPAGAGECAAPKLLQYAFNHQLKPIAMSEFWWGASPKSEVRKHGNFYPACRGKCEPILGYMLIGMKVDENPMLQNPALGKELEIVFEDEYMAIVNKPAEFLSVPGKNIQDSVTTRMQQRYPNASGPLVVHRLDMSTSGLMLIAKTTAVHKKLQQQFINRSIKKRYVALLDGVIPDQKGTINLPLRVDLENRPHQLVCYEHGKAAQTEWEVVQREDQRTRIFFYPITGRTHQLRVHAAHSLGLNIPIVGDDLYGKRDKHLHLHAESITFKHPKSNELMTIQVDPNF